MIRASRIPPLLSRICGNGVKYALLLTSDGELLGSSSSISISNGNGSSSNLGDENDILDEPSVGALVAEVAGDYRRAGNELLLLNPKSGGESRSRGAGGRGGGNDDPSRSATTLQCLITELDMGLIGVANAGADCLVIAVADRNVPYGLLKARLTALAGFVQESFLQLAEHP